MTDNAAVSVEVSSLPSSSLSGIENYAVILNNKKKFLKGKFHFHLKRARGEEIVNDM